MPSTNNPRLVAANHGVDNSSCMGIRRLLGQAVELRTVIEAAVKAANIPFRSQPLQRIVDRGAGAQVQKVDGRPDGGRLAIEFAMD